MKDDENELPNWDTKDKIYARFPVKAINALADMKEYKALRLLVALCTYMDMNTHQCWPSYPEIMRRSGLGKNDIRPSLNVLESLRFVKVQKKYKGGQGLSNFYTVREYGYMPHLWEEELRSTLPIVGVCMACANPVRPGQYSGKLNGQNIHFRCGGSVILHTSKSQAERHKKNKPPRNEPPI